jgi:hypothetical protein
MCWANTGLQKQLQLDRPQSSHGECGRNFMPGTKTLSRKFYRQEWLDMVLRLCAQSY